MQFDFLKFKTENTVISKNLILSLRSKKKGSFKTFSAKHLIYVNEKNKIKYI